MEKPFTLKQWASMGARWLTQSLRAKPAEQREKADRAMAAEHAMQNVWLAAIDLNYFAAPTDAIAAKMRRVKMRRNNKLRQ
jgi:hypothetical protein